MVSCSDTMTECACAPEGQSIARFMNGVMSALLPVRIQNFNMPVLTTDLTISQNVRLDLDSDGWTSAHRQISCALSKDLPWLLMQHVFISECAVRLEMQQLRD